MDGGIFVNLFEIEAPTSISVHARAWNGESTKDLVDRLHPAHVFADDESRLVYAYGAEDAAGAAIVDLGFVEHRCHTQETPKFIARFAIDAIIAHLQQEGFVLAERAYASFRREIYNPSQPLQVFQHSLAVFQAYELQTMYLSFDEALKYCLVVTPRQRYDFQLPIERIAAKVDCTNRVVKAICPPDCPQIGCDLHRWRGRILGRFAGLTHEPGFACQYSQINNGINLWVKLSDGRLEASVPCKLCQLEASLANIRYIFGAVLESAKVSDLVSRIRILSGDLQATRLVNTEVGRKRHADCVSFARRLSANFQIWGSTFRVVPDPLRAVEGVPPQDSSYDFMLEEGDGDGDDLPF